MHGHHSHKADTTTRSPEQAGWDGRVLSVHFSLPLPDITWNTTQLFHNKYKLGKTKSKKKAAAAHAFLNNKHIKMLIKSCFSRENDGKILSHNAEINTASFFFHVSSQPKRCKDQVRCGARTLQALQIKESHLLLQESIFCTNGGCQTA